MAQESASDLGRTFTTDADFALGTFDGARAGAPQSDQLRIATGARLPPFLWVANSNLGTVTKVDTRTGKQVARYDSVLTQNWDGSTPSVRPPRDACNFPVHTAVDANGDVFVVNRGNCSGTFAAITKYTGSLARCIDRNGDGVITTSVDANGDGIISTSNAAEFAGQSDDCIQWTKNYAGVDDPGRSLVVDAEQNVWVAGYGSSKLYKLSGDTGAALKVIDLRAETGVTTGILGLAVGPGGYLYTSDGISTRSIRKINPNASSGSHVVDTLSAPVATFGITVDRNGMVWLGADSDSVSGVVRADFVARTAQVVGGGGGCVGRTHGVAVDAAGDIWAACWSSGRVLRVSSSGSFLNSWVVGTRPEGVAVAPDNRIWVVNSSSDSLSVINPTTTGSTQTHPAGGGLPLTSSDMTGFQHHHFTLRQGIWSVVHDSGQAQAHWGTVSWNSEPQGATPPGSSIQVYARAADTREALSSRLFTYPPLVNGQAFTGVDGRFLEIKVVLRSANFGGDPVLSDLTISRQNSGPMALCQSRDVCATQNSCAAQISVDNGSYDPDGDPLTLTQSPAGPYGIGARDVVLTASDANSSASCTANIRVRDCSPPAITCASPVIAECTGNESATVASGEAQATDQCSAVSVSGPETGSYPLGSTAVTYTATDAAGNSETCTSSVRVVDTLPPSITCPAETTIECANGGAFSSGVGSASATDGCSAVAVAAPTAAWYPLGTATLAWSATDTSGNVAQCSAPLNVVDTRAPVITLQGSSSQLLECGTGYTEPGYSANDACQGDVSDEVVATGTVDTQVPGTYTRRYSVADGAGNSASVVTRNVAVVDTLAPSVTLNGSASEVLECGASFIDPGVSTDDSCSGAEIGSLVITGAVDSGQLGTYTLSYAVTDPSGNLAPALERTVTLRDTLAPTLALNGLANEVLECGEAYVPQGARAIDACAGDLAAVVVTTGSVNPAQPGAYELRYTVADPSGNAAPALLRTVTVRDTQAPAVALNGAASSTVECGTSYTEQGATASDACMGTQGVQVTITGSVDTAQLGPQTLSYRAVDSAGNTSAPVQRTVTVQDTQGPTLALNGPATLSLACGTPFIEQGATAHDLCLGDMSNRVTISGTVDIQHAGNYVLTYNATDTAGHVAPSVTRTVQVSDSEGPTLALTGANPMQLECMRDWYSEPGATAVDACAGNVSGSINIQHGYINSATPGSYPVTYTATDGANTATAVRDVQVRDTLPPDLYLNGGSTLVLECRVNTYSEQGAVAQDLCAGNLSGAVAITGEVDANVPGAYPVRYRVEDGHGFTTEKVRDVRVVDTRPPTLVLAGSGTPTVECSRDAFLDVGATATDVCAGDVTHRITVSGTQNIVAPGTYPITYSVTDPSGNAAESVTRNVTVRDSKGPVVTVNGQANMELECKVDTYTELGATAYDACQGDMTSAINIYGSGANTSAVGTYNIQYGVWDVSGNTTMALRTVKVVDRLKPTLTLVGSSIVQHECASGEFVDPGYSAFDVCYGDLTQSVTKSGWVNAWVLGSYPITYNVQDSTLLKAPTLTRTVQVVDTQGPTLTYRQVSVTPADQTMRNFTLADCVTANDVCDGWSNANNGTILSIYSDEPEDASGDSDGSTVQDIVITGRSSFRLRAERQSNGNGRVYGVRFELKDLAGNARPGLCQITVPSAAGRGVPADDGAGAGYTVSAPSPTLASRGTP
ncbi:immunoglobulin-like domain-containing protein [Hyalangium rubrum]|uniref:DUF5011 domain-containing protein n=1 Tax=Hyalangium rubrum TaxID=3103134 RepID=A0ABU5H6H8_9BACT|nr:immunoglobulin-like domain-containing protein [Hyalangium sp. s54d21]MDY7229082.1 DUF5011 domain-containing protein [Hyalangium sp. s54d21]